MCFSCCCFVTTTTTTTTHFLIQFEAALNILALSLLSSLACLIVFVLLSTRNEKQNKT